MLCVDFGFGPLLELSFSKIYFDKEWYLKSLSDARWMVEVKEDVHSHFGSGSVTWILGKLCEILFWPIETAQEVYSRVMNVKCMYLSSNGYEAHQVSGLVQVYYYFSNAFPFGHWSRCLFYYFILLCQFAHFDFEMCKLHFILFLFFFSVYIGNDILQLLFYFTLFSLLPVKLVVCGSFIFGIFFFDVP